VRLLQDGLRKQAEARPDANAVVLGEEHLTLEQLEHKSNQLAHVLNSAGCRRGDRVCLLLPKSLAAIIGIYGTLKAGCIYVPVDISNPLARVENMIEVCRPRAILAGASAAGLLKGLLAHPTLRSTVVGWMDDRETGELGASAAFRISDLESVSSTATEVNGRTEDAAYIMFTSGSTGTPKGVVITHANVTTFLSWAIDYFGLSHSDRISCHPPLHFDLSVFDIFGSISAGSELHLIPPELSILPNKLAELIRESRLTQWFSVPSALTYMAKFNVVEPDDFPALKRVLWCGEILPTWSLIYWMERLGHVQFTNLYGPTETTIASSFYTVPSCPEDSCQRIPIGTACSGEELLVLDNNLQPVPVGNLGELYIRGAGLSPGYWKDPERTRQAFVPYADAQEPGDRLYRTGDLARLDPGGQIWFHGRTDSQIKSRGHRIELGEIETALQALEPLKESAVVAIETDGFEGAAIVCAYSLDVGVKVSPAELRRALSERVPKYMLPSRWLELEALPKNATGKIDRRRLRTMFQSGRASSHE